MQGPDSTGRILTRQPFAALGALALLSLADDLLQLHEWIEHWISAWRGITFPIWDFLLGPLLRRFDLHLSDWMKDYLSIGLVVFGMNLRSRLYEVSMRTRSDGPQMVVWHLGPFPVCAYDESNALLNVLFSLLDFLEGILLWPAIIVNRVYRSIRGYDLAREKLVIFMETLVWVLMLVAFSYALTGLG